jgi:hypothetical protein
MSYGIGLPPCHRTLVTPTIIHDDVPNIKMTRKSSQQLLLDYQEQDVQRIEFELFTFRRTSRPLQLGGVCQGCSPSLESAAR